MIHKCSLSSMCMLTWRLIHLNKSTTHLRIESIVQNRPLKTWFNINQPELQNKSLLKDLWQTRYQETWNYNFAEVHPSGVPESKQFNTRYTTLIWPWFPMQMTSFTLKISFLCPIKIRFLKKLLKGSETLSEISISLRLLSWCHCFQDLKAIQEIKSQGYFASKCTFNMKQSIAIKHQFSNC